MYDAEIMGMLSLIHSENQIIFELQRNNLSKEAYEKITFKPYQDAYDDIMKRIEKQSPCSNCSYKNRFEKMEDILKDKGEIK